MAKNLIGNIYYDSNETYSINTYQTTAVQKGTRRIRMVFEGEQQFGASEIAETSHVDFSSLINDTATFTVLGKNLNLSISTETFEGANVYADCISPVLISGGGTTIFSEPVSPTTKKSNFFVTEIEGSFNTPSSDYICGDCIMFNVINTATYSTPLGTAVIETVPFWN